MGSLFNNGMLTKVITLGHQEIYRRSALMHKIKLGKSSLYRGTGYTRCCTVHNKYSRVFGCLFDDVVTTFRNHRTLNDRTR